MAKKKIKIFFCDFWDNFDKHNNLFFNLLNTIYDVEYSDNNPDLLFFSVFGYQHYDFNCKKIFFTGENIRPNFNECDYAFSFDFSDDKRNFRLPLYALFDDVYKLTEYKDANHLFKQKTKFCNFIYSNPGPQKRNQFFKKLSKYKKVDSGGQYLNNLGYKVSDKLNFIKNYKFTISFENQSYPGYTTEKIFQPFIAGSIPVYWGNPLVNLDFNTKSFINYHDFSGDEEVIEKIIELDQNDDKYIDMLSHPNFKDNIVNEYVKNDNIIKDLIIIIETPIRTISQKSHRIQSNKLKNTIYKDYHRIKYFNFLLKRKAKNISLAKLKIKLIGNIEEK